MSHDVSYKYYRKQIVASFLSTKRRSVFRRTVQYRLYALLTMMLAQVTGYEPGDFVHVLGTYISMKIILISVRTVDENSQSVSE